MKEIENLKKKVENPEFWKNPIEAKSILKEISKKENMIKEVDGIRKEIEDLKELVKIEGEDPEIFKEIQKEIEKVERKIEEIEIKSVLNSEDDYKNCILTIHPGAGGTESHDWASMLLRMYIRFCERKNFKVDIDVQPAEVGIKSGTLFVEGEYAYGILKAERGVHRLIRISPFDASRKRHTSFAAVFVYPEREEIEVPIKEDDLKIETFRASGPGGQHVQKASTAIRITHIPTGITVSCQSERSLHQNRENAMKLLRARVYEYYKKIQDKKFEELEKEKTEIAWGNQIRSYILHPYKLVKDHRTGYETSQVNDVLDGNLEEFIRKFLLFKNKGNGKT